MEKVNEKQRIRKSIYKPYRYDNTNGDHNDNLEMLSMMTSLSIISVVIMVRGPWPLYIWAISVALIILIFKVYNKYNNRYFRLIKRTKQSGGETTLSYHVQTYVSTGSIEKISSKQGVKWREAESFNSIEEAQEYFDQYTIEKDVEEVLIHPAKKSTKKLSFRDRFMEKNNLSSHEISAFRQVSIAAVIYIVFLFVYSGILGLLLPLGITIVLGLVIYALYILRYHRYYRIIERKGKLDSNGGNLYFVQTAIDQKGMEEKLTHKNVNWKDVWSNASKEEVEQFFEEQINEIEVLVTNEVL